MVFVLNFPQTHSQNQTAFLKESSGFRILFNVLFSKDCAESSALQRRRRDLNPRAAINDLLPFQGSPFGQLGYFSKLIDLRLTIFITENHRRCRLVVSKRRGWDSNPRALADKRFSRPPRYDHFDTSPYQNPSFLSATIDIVPHPKSSVNTKSLFFATTRRPPPAG